MKQRVRPSVEQVRAHIEGLFPKAFTEGWNAANLNLAADAAQWPTLPESTRERVLRALALFNFLEQAVATYLGPIFVAAPSDRDRNFLGTQIGDEVHHTYFFLRLFREVIGHPTGIDDSRQIVSAVAPSGCFAVFDKHLAAAVEALRVRPKDRVAWVKAILIYHILVEGIIANGGQSRLINYFKAKAVLSGMQAGFERLKLDESRHIAWGVAILQLCLLEDPGLAGPMIQTLHELVDPVVLAVVDPDLKQPADDRPRLPDWRHLIVEDKLICRLGIIGFEEDAIAGVRSAFATQFERRWDEHLARHGVEHSGRSYYLSHTGGAS